MTSTDLETVEHNPATLFGSDEPGMVVARASAVAAALKDVLQKQKLVANIQGKMHVLVDGWTLCGTLLGVFPVVVRTEELLKEEKIWGFEAYTEARTKAGAVVGAATARCTKDERRWKNADDYAILSMAQTRSVSKALRIPLGFIVSMAGYESTPAEEVPQEESHPHHEPTDEKPMEPAQTPVDLQEKARTLPLRGKIRRNHPNDPAVLSGELGAMTFEQICERWPNS